MVKIVISMLLAGLTPLRASADPGVTKDEVLIGSCMDLESPSGERGKKRLAAVSSYFSYVNENGGVHGRKLKLLALDDSYDPQKAVACFNELLSKDVFATGFFIGSPTGAKYASMAQARKVPAIGFNAGPRFLFEPVRRYVFNSRVSFDEEARQQVDVLFSRLGLKKVALLLQEDAFGGNVSESFKKALAQFEAAPVSQASFPRSGDTVEQAVTMVQVGRPDAVVLGCTGPPAARALKAAKAAGWKPLFITPTNDPALVKLAGDAAEGVVVIQTVPPPTREDLLGVALAAKALKKYAPNVAADFVTVEGALDAMLLVEGLKRAGPDLTREKLVDALESIRGFDIGFGPDNKVSYKPDDHQALNRAYFTVIRDGKPVEITDWSAIAKAAASK